MMKIRSRKRKGKRKRKTKIKLSKKVMPSKKRFLTKTKSEICLGEIHDQAQSSLGAAKSSEPFHIFNECCGRRPP
jgi:hypothetical protein